MELSDNDEIKKLEYKSSKDMRGRLNGLEKELKFRRYALRSLLVGIPFLTVILLEFLSFKYYPRSQKSLYGGELKAAARWCFVEQKIYDVKNDRIGESIGVYQDVKVDIFRSLIHE